MASSNLPEAPQQRFERLYVDGAPWEIEQPQPTVRQWTQEGKFRGKILDLGCGSGDNAIWLATAGHVVVGIDFVPAAIERAQGKSTRCQPPLANPPQFHIGNVLELPESLGRFDTILDSGLYHVFPPEPRKKYVAALARHLQPGGRLLLTCFSDRQPGTDGPLRMREEDLRADFQPPWHIVLLEPAYYRFRPTPVSPQSVVADPHASAAHAWRAEIEWNPVTSSQTTSPP